jgi:hypothetical protein
MIELVSPKLLDVVLADLSAKLEGIAWLDTAYGKASKQYIYKERIDVRGRTNQYFSYKDLAYPAIRVVGDDYINLFPNEKLGNYSWFHVFGRQDIEQLTQDKYRYEVPMSIIFFWDYRKVYNDPDGYSIENIKYDILQAIKSHNNIKVDSWEEDPESVFRGYDARETEVKHYMYPYGVVRLNCSISWFDYKNC